MCVALAALEAVVQVRGPERQARDPVRRFPPPARATRRSVDNTLAAATSSSRRSICRPQGFAGHYAYLKIRDRTSYAFALVSVAAALEMDGDTITRSAHRARRRRAQAVARARAEALLDGPASDATRTSRAWPRPTSKARRATRHNTFKIELAKRAIVRALAQAVNHGARAMTRTYIGQPQNRVDGRRKSPGRAKYAAESTCRDSPTASSSRRHIAKGRITRIDTIRRARGAGRDRGVHARERARAARTTTSATGRDRAARRRRSARCTTRRSSTAGSRSRSSSRRPSSSPAMRRRSCDVEYDERRARDRPRRAAR